MSLSDYFKENLPGTKESGSRLRGTCPFCNHSGLTLAIYELTFSVHCFYAECLYHKSVLQFIMDFEGLKYNEAFHRLKQYQRSFHLPALNQRNKEIEQIAGRYLSLSEIIEPAPVFVTISMNYLKQRGVTLDQIEKYQIGCKVDKFKKVQIIFSVLDENSKLEAWIERSMSGVYRIYPAGVDKSKLLYGFNLAKEYSTLILCEGAFDVFALGESALGLLGKSLTDNQFAKLLSLKPNRRFIITLDGDAKKRAFDIACKLNHYRETKVVFLQGRSDPSDLKDRVQDLVIHGAKDVI